MKSDKEDSKNQKEEDNSIPLLDLNQSFIKKLINQAKTKGYLTYSELNDTMPPGEMSSEQIEDIMTALSEMGITLIESDEEQEDKQENESPESESSKELVAASSTTDNLDRTDDPVRMYLREMGSVELLSREGEIAIAKRIEAGRNTYISGLCESPLTFQAITIWREELLDEKIMLRDVIDLDATFGSSSEVELNAETHQEKFEDSKPISDLNNKTLEESLPRNFNNFVDSNKTEREDKDTETSEIENEDFDLAESASSNFVNTITDAATGRVVKTIDGFQERNSQRGADATLYYRPSNNLSITTVAGINEIAANIFISSTGETRAQQRSAFIQTRVQSGNLFMQYNYTDTSNPTEDKYRGFNYRTGVTAGVESKQSQFQLQYEIALDQINTGLSIGVEHMSSKFDTGTATFGRFEDNDDYRIYGAYFSAKTKLSDKLNLQLAGRYDRYPEVGESSFAPRVALVYNPDIRNNFSYRCNCSCSSNLNNNIFNF